MATLKNPTTLELDEAQVALSLTLRDTMHRALIEAAPDCITLLSKEGLILQMNNAALRSVMDLQSVPIGLNFIDFIDPNSHRDYIIALDLAVNGECARFQLKTKAYDKAIIWDMILSPVRDDQKDISFILCVSRDVTANHLLEHALAEAVERETLMAQEMRHRIKNLFSIVSVLITMAEREAAASDNEQGLATLLKSRVNALARVSEASYLNNEINIAATMRELPEELDLRTLIHAALLPYEGMFSIAGDSCLVSRQHVTTLTLFLHELATNSVKYGALSLAVGHVDVTCHINERTLSLIWKERGGPSISGSPKDAGFGGKMIDRLIALSNGAIVRDWHEDGLITHLKMQL